jgi:hypothetical protein
MEWSSNHGAYLFRLSGYLNVMDHAVVEFSHVKFWSLAWKKNKRLIKRINALIQGVERGNLNESM